MIDWVEMVKRYHALGLWHASRSLATISTIKDPFEQAKDIVQDAWLTLWKKQRFSKALFVTVVVGLASNAARASKPIEIAKGESRAKKRGPQTRTTDTFPVQIFGGLIGEVTTDQDTDLSECGRRMR